LNARAASAPPRSVRYDIAEASALQTALVLFDWALAALGMAEDPGALARSDRTEHLEHLITVMAECAASGDLDGVRRLYEQHKGVRRG
jgi:hypothetical protein